MNTTTQKKDFYKTQILVHNFTKINDYVKNEYLHLESVINDFLNSSYNTDYLELGLNSNLHSKTKKEYSELFN
jgi:hypothetical protein